MQVLEYNSLFIKYDFDACYSGYICSCIMGDLACVAWLGRMMLWVTMTITSNIWYKPTFGISLSLSSLMTPGVSVRIFGVTYDHTFLNLQIIIIHHATRKVGGQTWWLHMTTLIFLRDLCGYVWVNILSLSPSRVEHWGGFYFERLGFTMT